MTKIKNTKKGMAKKTLSMSLVVAMLATSNVPVWAAEFSDGSDVAVATEAPATFADEADAPVVDETTDNTAAASVVTDGDITTNLTASAKSVVWGTTVTVTGTISDKKDTGITPQYRWVSEDGTVPTGLNGAPTYTKGTYSISLPTDKDLVGKTLTLYIYSVDGNPNENYDINTGITVKVEKKALKDFTIDFGKDENGNAITGLTYNGKEQYISTVTGVKDASNADVTDSDYTVHSSSTGKNAGDKVTVTVTANDNSAYVGSVSKTVAIDKATDEDGLVASTTEGLSYQYTGSAISIPKDKVALKESTVKFGGADVSSAITEAKTTTSGVGKSTVDVKIDPTKLANFKISKNEYKTTEKVEITKRDLSTAGTTISVKDGKVETGSTIDQLKKALNFKGVEGSTITDIDDQYTITVKTTSGEAVQKLDKTGTYVVTVTANENSTKLKGNQTFNVTTVGNVLQSAVAQKSYTTDYTGSAITPSKSEFGTLTVDGTAGSEVLQTSEWEITGYTNNTNATTYNADGSVKNTAKANIKILSGKYQGETKTLDFTITPLTVTAADITVPSTVSYNKAYTEAKEYKLPVKVVAKNSAGKVVKTLDAADYTVTYSFKDGDPNYDADGKPSENSEAKNEINDKIAYSVKITNTNFVKGGDKFDLTNTAAKMTTIKAKALADSMVSVNPSSYVYTGGTIVPSYVVMDGPLVLYKGDEYTEVSITDAVNVGTGKVTVEGKDPFYSGKAVGTFTITAANTSDVKVSIGDAQYTGKQIRPRTFKATLNGNDVTSQFEIVSYGENTKAGKGTVVLKPVAGNKNFTGSDITVEFNIVDESISGSMHVYNSKGIEYTSTPTFKFDGNEKTFAKVTVDTLTKVKKDDNGTITTIGKTKATANDLEIKYVDNVTGNHEEAYVYAVAKAGSGFAGLDTITTADGTIIKGVVAKYKFNIESVQFDEQNVTVKNATYAGGLPVKPEITIQIGKSTLVEGKDYTVELVDPSGKNKFVDVTNGKVYGFIITGINGYYGSSAEGDFDYWYGSGTKLCWGIDKKNLEDCTVTVKDGVVTVLNGYLPVPATEYTAKNNNDGTYTVTADSKSKNYTGSKTVKANGKAEDEKPDAPMISSVKVVGNKATVILSGEAEGATGYDYVISKDRDCINNKNYASVNKNQVKTTTDFTYVQQGTYYAYCHAWKRGADGKKVFGDWSNAFPFVVSAITPAQPVITSVKAKGTTVTVTYTQASNATGYDVVLGTAAKNVNGEVRPVSYGKLVKKNIKGNVVTATFKNVKKGTY